MRRGVIWLLTVALLFPVLGQTADAALPDALVPVGSAVRLELSTDGVYVVRFDEGDCVPARDAGLQVGDRIVSVDGRQLRRADELRTLVQAAGERSMVFRVERGQKTVQLTVSPAPAERGWRIGVFVQDHVTGIGTVTFYDPQTGSFGALGHGVNVPGTTDPMALLGGTVQTAGITSVQKGQEGTPGALRGQNEGGVLGTVEGNTDRGVYGSAKQDAWTGEALPLAAPEDVRVGKAEIWSSVSGTEITAYEVEIEALDLDEQSGRELCLHVTDPALLSQTGGIVQGMSGSPIIQNGRFVGAVTHVLVQDPTRGYGIYIGTMLRSFEAAQARPAKAA